ncbi:MAG: ATP-binding cassette domain-containing protein [Fastidiosipilaceae bacterium]|jgi:ABC-2 type transport system ATP-binding protein
MSHLNINARQVMIVHEEQTTPAPILQAIERITEMINIDSLDVFYGRYHALTIDRPIYVEPGDRVGIIGSNGAGKTTLIRALLGQAQARGNFSVALPPHKIAVHMQQNEYTSVLPIKVIIERIIDRPIAEDTFIQELISFFDFEKNLKKRYKTLSGGEKQRLTLILVLYQRSPLVFMDEVTSGLDFVTRQQVMELLVDWFAESNQTLCIVSHYYTELEKLVNKIIYLEDGQLVDWGGNQELFRKYCGKTVLMCENNVTNKALMSGYKPMAAPDHLLAFSCKDAAEEASMSSLLRHHDIDYRRTSNDIELMTINAKKYWESKV